MKTSHLVHRFDRCLGVGIGLVLLLAGWPAAARAAAPSGALTLSVRPDPATTVTRLLEPRNPAWAGIPAQRIHLNRTPPLYLGDPMDDHARPAATLQLVRIAGGAVVLRVRWSDPTDNRFSGGVRHADAGQPHVYPRQTEQTDAFADAFCVMIPVRRGPSAQYPSMMMGDVQQPVELYYWRAGAGFQLLGGHGRATTAPPVPAAPAPQGQALREGDGWTLTLTLPSLAPSTPVCLAIWDGSKAQRDGLKYFSLWYEVE